MAFTNSTTNYHLPQYVASDIPSYLVDQNDAWETIDNALGTISEDLEDTTTVANSASIQATNAENKADGADAKATGALNNEAVAFSTSATYNIGDYVIYNNVLYRCKSTVTVAGTFDGTQWETIKVGGELKSVKENLAKATNVKTWTRIGSTGIYVARQGRIGLIGFTGTIGMTPPIGQWTKIGEIDDSQFLPFGTSYFGVHHGSGGNIPCIARLTPTGDIEVYFSAGQTSDAYLWGTCPYLLSAN